MVNITINNIQIEALENSTIMEAAKSAGIDIPHLCYLKELNEIGACRLCCIEIEGEEKLVPACDNVVQEGMKIITNSARVRGACRTNLELIMSQHDGQCTTCVRSGNCQLQKLANDFNLLENRFAKELPAGKAAQWEMDFPLIRDAGKCVKCMRCIQICNKVQSLGVWDLVGTGSRTRVDVSENRTISQADCSQCGQCIVNCPVGALRERDDVAKVTAQLENPEVITVAQIAPAVRSAWAEHLGIPEDSATVSRLAGALKKLGFDYVFDTSFSADLTIMEEGSEFLEKKTKGELEQYPLFTSCCPGWVRFLKSQYPQLVGQLSTAKSPQQMFGAVVKSYFAEKKDIDPEKICCVSIMPCVAKKGECSLPAMKNNGVQNVDYALTTREVMRLLQAERIHAEDAVEVPFDNILRDYTGAGVIFGATGGVMEAALRSAWYLVTGENPNPDAFQTVHDVHPSDNQPWKEAEFDIKGTTVRVAVTSGLGNARKLCEAILRGEVHYDFVEIMACPGGCAGGGGQTIHCDDQARAEKRGSLLHKLDQNMPVRFSHENEDVKQLYKEWLEKPLSEKAEELLHTDHFAPV